MADGLSVLLRQGDPRCSSVDLENVERRFRLEASVFDAESGSCRELVQNGRYPAAPLVGEGGLADAYTCPRFKRIWVKKSQLPIYQPSTVLDIRPQPDGYLSPLTDTDIEALRVRRGQVLLTCSGTVGNVSLVSDTLDGAIFSHDLLRITPRDPADGGYLYAYLKSPVGGRLVRTGSYGAVITHVEAHHLAEVPVPNPPEPVKRRIGGLVEESFALRDESNRLLDRAAELLKGALAMPAEEPLESGDPVSLSLDVDRLEYRADASYHLPRVERMVEHLRAHARELTAVGDPRVSREVILPGRFKRVYVSPGYGPVLFGGKQLHELDPSNKKYLSLAQHGPRIAQELQIRENYILVTRSGTIGKVSLTPRHWQDWVASEHILRIVPADAGMAGYLSVFLASEWGRALIRRFTYGAVVDEIDARQLAAVPVPLLRDGAVQEEIGALALEASALRARAYDLEQEALAGMEEILGQ